MPIPLPAKTATLARSERWTIDWIDMWAIVLGTLATALAALVYVADHDPVASSFVFIGFAAIIGVMLRESLRPRQRD